MNTLPLRPVLARNAACLIPGLAALLLMLLLSNCSGGIGGTGAGAQSVSAQGVVTGKGSVIVNGIEFAVSRATQITLDDAPNRLESEIIVRQVVTINGTLDADGVSGTASRIVYADQLEGPISAIDSAANTLRVLGQTVMVRNITRFDGFGSLAELSTGDSIEVSGLTNARHTIVATYIKKLPTPASSRQSNVQGPVQNLTRTTFTLGGLTVDYSRVLPQNLPRGGLRNALFVEVKSILLPDPASGVLIATSVELENNFNPAPGEQVALEGFVANLVVSASFAISLNPVILSSTTEFINGSANDLSTDDLVIVRGVAGENGILASRITFVGNQP